MREAALSLLLEKACQLYSIFAVIVLEMLSEYQFIDLSILELIELAAFLISDPLIFDLHPDHLPDEFPFLSEGLDFIPVAVDEVAALCVQAGALDH